MKFLLRTVDAWIDGRRPAHSRNGTRLRMRSKKSAKGVRYERKGNQWQQVIKSSPKVTMKNGFPTDWRAGSLASIYASLWQSVDQIQRLAHTDFSMRAANKKSPLHPSRTACSVDCKGLENAKAGLVALAVIFYALCKLTSKSAQWPL
ncbi:hypothetical protein [Rhodoferax lacus]|uniref:hypothetical protein n=1 Tax=Rhodoferax lacus TaxID=2184758 RepID=UPI001F286FEF|nr:hypothetical protein [Rhodoferax lacus]